MLTGITAVVPSIPPRTAMLARALGSILAQSLPAAAVSVAVDLNREGAPKTRDRALQAVRTEWAAFCDDDDVWLPEHLEILSAAAEETGADYVYSYFTIVDSAGNTTDWDPLGNFGRPFNPADPHQTTITTLVRTELAQQVGFKEPPKDALIHGQHFGEDFQFTLDCVAAGAHIVHVPRKTWLWHHHGQNTSGLPTW